MRVRYLITAFCLLLAVGHLYAINTEKPRKIPELYSNYPKNTAVIPIDPYDDPLLSKVPMCRCKEASCSTVMLTLRDAKIAVATEAGTKGGKCE